MRTLVLLALAAAALARGASAQIPESEYALRRDAVARTLGGATLVVHAAEEADIGRSSYAPDPSYLYLTGIREPGGALVLRARDGKADARLFVLDRRASTEVWVGARLGPDGAARRTGVAATSRTALAAALDSLVTDTLFVVGDTANTAPIGALLRGVRASHPGVTVRSGAGLVARHRALKSGAERALLRRAASITTRGFDAAVAAIAPNGHEYEVEAALDWAFRRDGADGSAFPPIIASGDHATTLHYEQNDDRLPPNGLVLMDVGASFADYAADFTRTLPVSGRFTPAQRELYDVALAAQLAAERVAHPGAAFKTLSDTGIATLAKGLARLGLIEAPDATYDVAAGEPCAKAPNGACFQWFLYYMHAAGHGVGLAVHDPMTAASLDSGNVFMIELGAYVRRNVAEILPPTERNRAFLAHAAPALARYAGLGVRFEDEYAVTSDGIEWLTRWPRAAADVERRMRTAIARGAAPRAARIR